MVSVFWMMTHRKSLTFFSTFVFVRIYAGVILHSHYDGAWRPAKKPGSIDDVITHMVARFPEISHVVVKNHEVFSLTPITAIDVSGSCHIDLRGANSGNHSVAELQTNSSLNVSAACAEFGNGLTNTIESRCSDLERVARLPS